MRELLKTLTREHLDDPFQDRTIAREVLRAHVVVSRQSIQLSTELLIRWCWQQAAKAKRSRVGMFRTRLDFVAKAAAGDNIIEQIRTYASQRKVVMPAAAIEAKPDLRDDPRVQLLSRDDRIRFRSLWLDQNFNAASMMLEKVQVAQ